MEIKKLFAKRKISMLICFLLIILIGGLYISYAIGNPFKVNDKYRFEVKKDDNLYKIIDRLDKSNLIKNKLLLKTYVKFKKFPGEIKPGFYSIKAGESINSLVHDMNSGIFDETYVKVTIPEGFQITQIASALQKKGIISGDKFLKACKAYNIPSYIKNDDTRTYKLEGYLFPDTYEFKKNMEGKAIIDAMLGRFTSVIAGVKKEPGIKIDDLDKIITMASVVEREAEIEKERAVISSVFYNRIKLNMKLQSCATVEYALGYHKEKLTYNDLKVKSSYNTYLVSGLPQGPICSPGKSSIIAAAKPQSTDYIYFVSNNDGTHFFTKNYNEFLKVKEKTQGF